MIFDQLQELPQWDAGHRIYLQASALLHDIGHYLSSNEHHEYSYNLILKHGISGFDDEEVQTVACIARYHRKNVPSLSHHGFRVLSPRLQNTIKVTSPILRIADGLDRSHLAAVESINVKITGDNAIFTLESNYSLAGEIWAANRKKKLFEEIFQLNCNIETDYSKISYNTKRELF